MKLHLGNCNEHPLSVVDPTITCWAIRDEDRRKIGPDELMAYITGLENDLAKMTAWRDAAHRDREREEQACLQALEQRDAYHDTADDLADAIAKHFGQDFGEHSSANSRWANALQLIEGSYCR